MSIRLVKWTVVHSEWGLPEAGMQQVQENSAAAVFMHFHAVRGGLP